MLGAIQAVRIHLHFKVKGLRVKIQLIITEYLVREKNTFSGQGKSAWLAALSTYSFMPPENLSFCN